MSTRSRIRIRRRRRADVAIYYHFDGYFSNAGAIICNQLCLFLAGRTNAEAAAVADGMKVDYEGEGGDAFTYELLAAALNGEVTVQHDACHGVQFEYTLDLAAGVLVGRDNNASDDVYLTLDAVRAGATFEDALVEADIKAKILDACHIRMTPTMFAGKRDAIIANIHARMQEDGLESLTHYTEAEWYLQLLGA